MSVVAKMKEEKERDKEEQVAQRILNGRTVKTLR